MAAIVEEYKKIPLITRVYVTGCFLVTGACYLELLSPFQLYFSAPMIFKKYQVWRLFSNFFFFGSKFSLDYAFHLFFLTKYSSGLENGSFRDRTADFFYMLLFGSVCLMIIGPFFHLNFFGHSLSFMIVYIWSRRNAFTQLNFLGLFTFSAPYLPWVLLAFSMVLGGDGTIDMLGIAVGHIYFYLEDVYPKMTQTRVRFLRTPRFLHALFDHEDNPVDNN